MGKREEFLKHIRETFKIEASEGIAKITSLLIELEKGQTDSKKQELIEAMFREAHSLKGAARAVNFYDIETVCKALEDLFSRLKDRTLEFDAGLFNLFHQAVNVLNILLDKFGEEISENQKKILSDLLVMLSKAEVGEIDIAEFTKEENTEQSTIVPEKSSVEEIAEKAQRGAVKDTIRISLEKLDKLLFLSEEMLGLNQTFSHIREGIRNSSRDLILSWPEKIEGAENSLNRIRDFLDHKGLEASVESLATDIGDISEFIDWVTSKVKNTGSGLDEILKFITLESHDSSMQIESLLEEVQRIISVPISTILESLPKTARDIATDISKEVEVKLSGGELEIDRRILEEMRNPLIHLLRNCVDHGIEEPEIRLAKKKPAKGIVNVSVSRLENSRIEIVVSDDGAGIDVDKLKDKYIRQNKVSKNEQTEITEKVLFDFMFNSGISTSEIITDFSGRGLGLAIVKEKVEQLGGFLEVNSEKDKGTDFRIQLPLSLVTFRGVHIMVGEKQFVIPTYKIERVLSVKKDAVKTIENKTNVPYQDKVIPLVYMSDIFEIPFKEDNEDNILLIVMGTNENKIAFVVNEVMDEELILLRSFNSQLKRVRNIVGATVVGSGKVVPVINVTDLLYAATKSTAQRILSTKTDSAKKERSILVVEDSVTSRMLLKNILETSGYKVTTAVDGVEGYTSLKGDSFNLVISDVDMPRMNGFDMVAKIRSDSDISEIPVILVTSLTKREDRERGMEVGANAYIVKSSFDQGNLLKVVEQLIE